MFKTRRSRKRKIGKPVLSNRHLIDPLERRLFLSVSGSTLASADLVTGSQRVYNVTNSGITKVFTTTVIGPAVFNGVSTVETDSSFGNGTSRDYSGLDSSGNYVDYGSATPSISSTGGTDTDVYAPPLMGFPAVMEANTPYTTNYVDQYTGTDASGAVIASDNTNNTDTVVLTSETLVSVTVPAGTFDAYVITDTTTSPAPTDDDPNATDTTVAQGWIVPDVGMVKTTTTVQGSTSTYELTSFSNNQKKLAFFAPPSNVAAGDKFDPVVKVEVEDSTGSVKTDATDAISLTLTSTTGGTAVLAGTTTAAASGGIATFSDLSIAKPGTYTMTASSGGNTISSGIFTVSGGKLVFKVAPKKGTAGVAIVPTVTVELEDGKGKVITDASSVVTLAISGVNSTNPITGNTASLVNGVATFPTLKLGKAGTYKLQATDDENDTDIISGKFSVGGSTIAFNQQPIDGNVGVPLLFTVVLKNAQRQIQTDDSSDFVQIDLNNTTPGNGAVLSGTTTVQLVNGVARFTAAQDISIDKPGKYSFAATVVDGSGDLTGSAAAVVSRTFKLGGFHLAFLRAPASSDVNTPVPLTVAIKDGRNRTVTSYNGGQVNVAFTNLTGQLANSTYAFNYTLGFANGVATIAGSNAPKFTGYGSLRFQVTRFDSAGLNADPNTTSLTSNTVQIYGDKVAFLLQPKATDAGTGVEYKAAIENRHNQIVSTFDGDDIAESLIGVAATDVHADAGQNVLLPVITGGIADGTAPGSAVSTSRIGTFKIMIVVGNKVTNSPEQAVEPGLSKVFQNLPYHFAFTQQPLDSSLQSSMTVTVTLENTRNQVVQVPQYLEAFSFTAVLQSASGAATPVGSITIGQTSGTSSDYTGGPASFTFPGQVNLNQPLTAGRYRIQLEANYLTGDQSDAEFDVLTTQSRVFTLR